MELGRMTPDGPRHAIVDISFGQDAVEAQVLSGIVIEPGILPGDDGSTREGRRIN